MNTDQLHQCADAGAKAADDIAYKNLNGDEWICVHSTNTHYDEYSPAREAFARAAIETYLKLNPVWVRASERLPIPEDADQDGCVVAWDKTYGFYSHEIGFIEADSAIFWTSIKHLPPPPDPFEEWLAQQPDDVRAADKELVKKIYNSIKL